MALQNILIPFVSLFKSAGLKQAQNALGGLSRQYDSLGKTIGAAVGAMAGFNALQTAQQFVVQSVDATQKFERNLLALNQVFEQAAPQIKNFSKEVENYGLSQQQAAQASVFLGSVLKQYGFTTKEAADQTENLVKLAQDLATTYGYDVQESLLAITALFRGEYDPIEKFGVAMKQNEINAELAARGLGDLTGAAEMQAAAQIRLELLFERAGDSMGAFTRASDTLYGSQQRLNAAVGNLQVAFGAPLQGPLADINNIFADIVQDSGANLVMIAESLGEGIENVAPAIELVLTSFANLSIALVPVIETLNTIIGLFTSIIELSNDVAAAILRATKLPDETVVAARKVVIETQAEVDRLTEKQEDLNKAIESGYTAYGTYETQIENIERQIQETITGTTDANTESRRDMARASRFAADAAYAAQQDIEKLSAANDAYTRSWTKRAVFEAQQMGTTFFELRRKALGLDEGKSSGKNFVKDFFDGITDNVKKESSRIKLEAMGASEGLIEAILGAGGWEQVYNKVIKGGIDGLKELQTEFNKTAAGIAEVTEEAERLAKAQRDALEAAQSAIDANVESLKNAASQAASALATAEEAARQFRKYTMENLTNVQILPDVEEELGRFESAIIGTITSIQSELQGVFRSGLIEEADFDKLSQWAETESRVLRDIGRQRDNLAKRYSLSKALISEYQDALTGSLRLVSIFNSLKSQTETTMVTEVSEGVIRLGNTLKEFGVTVTRTYEKTIDETAVKGEGLVTGFRNMAQKARDFAGNLQKLRDMGLDPQLFSELVQAGVEAGGETAQALVDGGSATILEINSLFSEINKLGAELGMDVGQTMYEAGQDMTFGLLDGIKSEQQQLYDEAKNLAQKFSEAFENNLNIAIDIPIKAAKEALEVADNAVQSAQMADIANLIKIDGLIKGAKEAFDVVKSESTKIGIAFKQGVFEALRTDILAGKQFDLSGIVRGMSSAALIPAVGALGSSAVGNYFTLTVNAGMGADGSEIGQTIVNEILKFERSSGQVFSRA
jgi:hypothetical protein